MKREKQVKNMLSTASSFFSFFVLAAALITCCLMLFISTLQKTIGHNFTQEEITAAAKITFINVVLISAIMAFVDYIRRITTVKRPVQKITEATEKMIKGDFSVRLKPINKFAEGDYFNDIIRCINRMAEELSGVETLRADFISNVSHEMKTPLAVIQNYGALLEREELSDEKRKEYAGVITSASRRLSDMMTNILKLNRLENQSIYPAFSRFNLGEQLCECLLQYESVWERKNIEIETDIDGDVFVFADPELLSLVWNNLFSNAFKFTDDGGRVTLALEEDGEYVSVKISDTGCGMTSDIGVHIFEKFYQADTSRATEGNGLGLALVKRVVDILQAEIGVESEVGVGTTFTVKIRRDSNELEEAR